MDAIKEKEFLGSGWGFPVSFSVANHRVRVSKYEANINESIHIILQTFIGERIMNPQFGSGLHGYMFKKLDETLKGDIIDSVKSILLDNEPRVKILNVLIDNYDVTNGLIAIQIDYEYIKTNTRHNYVFPFHIIEGTNLEIK
ncbi:MAG: GPW/gp25 family protein [Gilvibacter sp.]